MNGNPEPPEEQTTETETPPGTFEPPDPEPIIKEEKPRKNSE